MKKILLLLLLISLTSMSCKKEKINKATTIFSMADQSLEEILGSYSFDIAVVNYFATYCSPCKKEMPLLQKISEQYSDKNILFISISSESEQMSDTINSLMSLLGISYPVYYDGPNNFFGDTISILPLTYVINKDYKVIKKLSGLFSEETMTELLDVSLKQTIDYETQELHESTKYTITTKKKDNEFSLIFKGNPPYILGGEKYPPTELTLTSTSDVKKITFQYNKHGYEVFLNTIPADGLINGHIKAYACTDSSCFIIDENFTYTILK